MRATIDIFVALVVALVVYVLGAAILQQEVGADPQATRAAAAMTFIGP